MFVSVSHLVISFVTLRRRKLPASKKTSCKLGLPTSSYNTNGLSLLSSDQRTGEFPYNTNGLSLLPSDQRTGEFGAVMPPTETLVGMGVIAILCVVLYWVWENQVVPVSRTKLAISKSRGEVKEYLDELKASSASQQPSTSALDVMNENTMAQQSNNTSLPRIVDISVESNKGAATIDDKYDNNSVPTTTSSSSMKSTPSSDDRAFERWLFTDWLADNKSEKKAGRQKEPALPVLKNAKWNSGDNPVVVSALLMMIGIIISLFTERIGSFVG